MEEKKLQPQSILLTDKQIQYFSFKLRNELYDFCQSYSNSCRDVCALQSITTMIISSRGREFLGIYEKQKTVYISLFAKACKCFIDTLKPYTSNELEEKGREEMKSKLEALSLRTKHGMYIDRIPGFKTILEFVDLLLLCQEKEKLATSRESLLDLFHAYHSNDYTLKDKPHCALSERLLQIREFSPDFFGGEQDFILHTILDYCSTVV